MAKMRFSNRWVSLILACIRLVTYSIMLNGQPYGLITPSHGLCQGDPLSPYLFLRVKESLHAFFGKVEDGCELMGVALCLAGPQVSHLLFVDDSLVFARPSFLSI